MEFYHKLQSIINSHSDKNLYNYVTTASSHSLYQGIYHLDLLLIKNDHDDKMNVKLQLLLMDYKISQCSIWEVVLDDTAILKHMDDDIGLFDYPIDKFASIFYNCLLSDSSIHLDDDSDAIYDDTHINLSLTYTIDGGLLEGRLKLSLIQENIHPSVYSMMQGIVNSSATTTTTATAMDGVRSNIQKNQAMQPSIDKTMTMTIKHDDNNNTRILHQSSSVPTIVSDPISATTTTTSAEAVIPIDDAITSITSIAASTTTTSIADKSKRKRAGGTMIHPGRKK